LPTKEGNIGCVSIETSLLTPNLIQTVATDTFGTNIVEQPIALMSDITQVTPRSMFCSIHESTAPMEIMRDIEELNFFEWENVSDNDKMGVTTNTQQCMQSPLTRVSTVGKVCKNKILLTIDLCWN